MTKTTNFPDGTVDGNLSANSGDRVLVWEDSTCRGAPKAGPHNCWSPSSRDHALQQTSHRSEKPVYRHEEQPPLTEIRESPFTQ